MLVMGRLENEKLFGTPVLLQARVTRSSGIR
jgi:hypothetical protein